MIDLFGNIFYHNEHNSTISKEKSHPGWSESVRNIINKLLISLQKIFLHLRKLNLHKKLMLIMVAMCSLVFLTCYIVFSSINQQNIRAAVQNKLEDTYRQKSNEFKNYIENIDYIAYTVMYSNWLQDLLNKRYANMPVDAENTRLNANHFLSSLSSINNDLRFVLFSSGKVLAQNHANISVRYGYKVENEPWYNEMVENGKYVKYEIPHNVYYNAVQPMLTFFYPVRNNYSRQVTGCLMISIPFEVLQNFEKVYTDQYKVRITDANGIPIISDMAPVTSFTGEGFFSVGDLRGYRGSLALDGWYLEVLQTNVSFQILGVQPYHILFLLMIPVALFCLLVTGLFSYYLSKPILMCKNAILAVRDNNLGVQIHNTYKDEIGELIEGFNEMSSAIANLVDQNKVMYLLKRDTELELLMQKINPHFLYNTLEILNGLILEREVTEAARLCETLGRMFRYNLDERRWVTIKDECEQIRLYLIIVGCKNMGIEYEIDIEEGLENYIIPKFILQPIVENSLKHGLTGVEQGCIAIRICSEGDNIRFVIMDNGIGMEDEELESLIKSLKLYKKERDIRKQQKVSEDYRDFQGHMGLYNVYERLRLEYGETMQFKMISAKGRGTCTEFSIPKRESQDD